MPKLIWNNKAAAPPIYSPLVAALEYAAQGIYIFPCVPDAKRPLTQHGFKSASIDPDQITKWWTRWPQAWIGMATGSINDFVVFDLDCKPGQASGVVEWPKFLAHHSLGELPTRCNRTPSGGMHFTFKANGAAIHSVPLGKIWPGIEIKGDGGYVIIPPSPGYVLIGDEPYNEAPQALVDLVLATRAPLSKPIDISVTDGTAPMDELVAALAIIPNDHQEWDYWNRVGMSLYRASSGKGFDLFDEWSKKCSSAYNQRTTRARWRSYKSCPPTELGAGTLFMLADEADPSWREGPQAEELSELGAQITERMLGKLLVDEEEEFPAHLLQVPGLVGETSQWINDASVYPQPLFSLAAALALVGTACGRYFMGPTKSGTHLFFICVAPSGHGKDWPLKAIGSILLAAGLQNLVGPSQFMSMSSAINFLKRQPLSVCCMDEFGAFLRRINGKNASGFEVQISSILRTAWSSSFTVMTTPEWAGKSSENIYAPAPSVFGLSTKNEFYDSLAGADIVNGMLNRCTVLESSSRPTPRTPLLDSLHVPKSITDHLKEIYDASGGAMSKLSMANPSSLHNPNFWKLSISPGADKIRSDFLSETHKLADQLDEDRGAFWVRTAEIAIRLATIVTVGQGVDCVEADVMQWACDFSRCATERLMKSALGNIADSETQEIVNSIKSSIRKHCGWDGWIKRADLWRRLKDRFDHKRVATALASMIQNSEEIDVRSIAAKRKLGGGRPSIWYSLKRD